MVANVSGVELSRLVSKEDVERRGRQIVAIDMLHKSSKNAIQYR